MLAKSTLSRTRAELLKVFISFHGRCSWGRGRFNLRRCGLAGLVAVVYLRDLDPARFHVNGEKRNRLPFPERVEETFVVKLAVFIGPRQNLDNAVGGNGYNSGRAGHELNADSGFCDSELFSGEHLDTFLLDKEGASSVDLARLEG